MKQLPPRTRTRALPFYSCKGGITLELLLLLLLEVLLATATAFVALSCFVMLMVSILVYLYSLRLIVDDLPQTLS